MTTTPQRRGLGRGLGSLIPTSPLPHHGASTDGATSMPVAGDRDLRSGPDWIGRPAGADEPISGEERGGSGGADEQDVVSASIQDVIGAYFAELPVAAVVPNPRQPRQVFDEDAMDELVQSIHEVGLLQPVVVRETGPGQYELVMGERRWRATQQAGLDTIPAIVRETADDHLLRDALLENLHRAQLNPLEEAAAYQQLLEDFGCTHDELAKRLGRSRPQITNMIRLLRLSPPVQRRVAAGVLTAGHARALLSVDDAEAQDRLAGRVVAEGISVRGLEELVTVGALTAPTPPSPRRLRPTAPGAEHLAERLSDLLDTRVRIELGRSKGRITVEFASLGDLERIVAAVDPSYHPGDDHAGHDHAGHDHALENGAVENRVWAE